MLRKFLNLFLFLNLARNKYLKRYGSGNRGGYITDEGIDIWAKWIIFSGQDPELLDSVRYEVKR